MKIKKKIKRERSRKSRLIFISIVIMLLVPYIISVLIGQGAFHGWEEKFAYIYALLIDILLVVNIFRLKADDNYHMIVKDGKIFIKDSIFRKPFAINPEKATYVDVLERPSGDFDIIIIMNNMRRDRRFQKFNSDYIRQHPQHKPIYKHLMETRETKDFFFYIISKAGSRKYYYLYLLYKNLYGAEFTKASIEKVKMLMEEYNLS